MADPSLVFAGKVNTISQWVDISGYGNHAIQSTATNQPSIVSGSASVVMNATIGSSVYYFDGVAAPNHKCFYIPYDDSLYLNNNWTISCWINAKVSSRSRLFSTELMTPMFYIDIDVVTYVNKILAVFRDVDGSYIFLVSNALINDGLWHFIVTQRANGFFWVYIDGKYDNKVADTLGSIGNTNNIYFGARLAGEVPYKGYMVTPRIWRRFLIPSEIEEQYKLGLINIRG